jgi:hypothetical protein
MTLRKFIILIEPLLRHSKLDKDLNKSFDEIYDEDEESFQDKEENKATSSDKTKKNQEIIKLNF